jgi:hypothetical protein
MLVTPSLLKVVEKKRRQSFCNIEKLKKGSFEEAEYESSP